MAVIEGKNVKISIYVPKSTFSFYSNVVGCTRNSTVQGSYKVKINELAQGIKACWSIKEKTSTLTFHIAATALSNCNSTLLSYI